MTRRNFNSTISNWSPGKRIERAEIAIKEVTKELDQSLQRWENIRHMFLEQNLFLESIIWPASIAFDQLRHDALSFSIIRLLSIWEKPAENSYSIPTIILLVDDHRVFAALENRMKEKIGARQLRILNNQHDPSLQRAMIEAVSEGQQSRANNMAVANTTNLYNCIADARAILSQSVVENAKKYRDLSAHFLEYLRDPKSSKSVQLTITDLDELLQDTVAVCEILYSSVNGISYDLNNDVRRICRSRADEFWQNLKFTRD